MHYKSKHKNHEPFKFEIDGFSDYVKREIFLIPRLVGALVEKYTKAGKINFDYLKIKTDRINKAYIITDEANYGLAVTGRYNIEVMCDIICVNELISDFNSTGPILDKSTLVIALCADENYCLSAKLKSEKSGAKFIGIYDFAFHDKCTISIDFKSKADMPTASTLLKLTALLMLFIYIGKKNEVITELYYDITVKMLFSLEKKLDAVIKSEYLLKQTGIFLKNKKIHLLGANVDFGTAIYAAYIINCFCDGDAFSSALTDDEKSLDKYVSVFIASSCEHYSLLGSRQVSLSIAPDGISDKNVFTFDESIPLFNTVINMLCMQMIMYYMK